MKKLSIGIDDFKKIIDDDMYYVDKSLLIKEIIDVGSEVTLITRPRRFGKTINMSMLKYFFEKTEIDYSYLFENLQIEKKENAEYIEEQNKYPVIFISLKDAKGSTWEKTYEVLKKIISNEYEKHSYLLDSDVFNKTSRELRIKRFKRIIINSFIFFGI
jgi:phosphopantetheine adenylyltransferase